jgi:hypothetical protein
MSPEHKNSCCRACEYRSGTNVSSAAPAVSGKESVSHEGIDSWTRMCICMYSSNTEPRAQEELLIPFVIPAVHRTVQIPSPRPHSVSRH